MTKKDYEKIAKAVRHTRQDVGCDPSGVDAIDALIDMLVSTLLADNPNFNPDKFRKACKE